MLIFRFEWKRKRKYILIWAATLAVCIFSMTPVYYGGNFACGIYTGRLF